MTYYSRYVLSGRVISSSQKLPPYNTQKLLQKNVLAPSGIFFFYWSLLYIIISLFPHGGINNIHYKLTIFKKSIDSVILMLFWQRITVQNVTLTTMIFLIRTYNLMWREAADLRLRSRGHWNWLKFALTLWITVGNSCTTCLTSKIHCVLYSVRVCLCFVISHYKWGKKVYFYRIFYFIRRECNIYSKNLNFIIPLPIFKIYFGSCKCFSTIKSPIANLWLCAQKLREFCTFLRPWDALQILRNFYNQSYFAWFVCFRLRFC